MRKALLLSTIIASGLLGMDPAVQDVKAVYILKMGGGLDQYLASELSIGGVYTVTTDPQKADAVFTDSLGEGFEKKFKDLYAPPPPPPKVDENKDAKDLSAPVVRVGGSTMGRGKGTVFLVQKGSGNLLWSMNRQPKNSSTHEMVEQARKVVEQLKKDLMLLAPK